jgi:hypothetical protein
MEKSLTDRLVYFHLLASETHPLPLPFFSKTTSTRFLIFAYSRPSDHSTNLPSSSRADRFSLSSPSLSALPIPLFTSNLQLLHRQGTFPP